MNMDYKQIVEDALNELSPEITDANDECGGEENNHSTHEDFIADVLDAAFSSGCNDGSEHEMAAIAGAAVDEFMFSEVLDSVDGDKGESVSSENADHADDSDDNDKDESGEDETMLFEFKIDLAEYAKRFGIQLPDDSPDAFTDDGKGSAKGEVDNASTVAKDCSCCDTVAEDAATMTFSPNFAPGSLEGKCQAELKDCRAKNPMTCRYHGAKVITNDIEAALSAANVKAKSINVRFIGVTSVLGKQYLTGVAKVVVKPSKTAKKNIMKAMNSFANIPGIEFNAVGTSNGRSYSSLFDIDMLDPNAKARWGRRGEGDDGETEQDTDAETEQGAVVENPIKSIDDAVKSAMSEVSEKGGFASEDDMKDVITGAVSGDNASMDYLLHHLGDDSPVVAWVVSEQQNDKKDDADEQKKNDAAEENDEDKNEDVEVNVDGDEEDDENTHSESEDSPYGNEKQTEFFNKMNDDLPEDSFILSAKVNKKGVLTILSVDGNGTSTVTCVAPDGTSYKRKETVSEKAKRMSIASFVKQEGYIHNALSLWVKNGGSLVNANEALANEYLDSLSKQDRTFLAGKGGMPAEDLVEAYVNQHRSSASMENERHYDGDMTFEDVLGQALMEYHQYLDWKKRGGVSFEMQRLKHEEAEAKAREVKIGGDSYDLEDLEANEAGRAAYDDAVAEVEQNGAAVRNFSRGELRNLRKGDILRFDHSDWDWSVESYDDKNGEIVVTAHDIADNPLYTDEERAEFRNRRFCITEHGWVELNERKEKKNGNERKNDEGTDKTVGGDEEGERGGEEELRLESATAEELNDEKQRSQKKAEIERRQDAPLKTGKGEVGQSLLDLGGAEGGDLLNRTQRSNDNPSPTAEEKPVVAKPTVKPTAKPTMTPVEANKVLGMSSALSDSELRWKQRIWASHSKDPKFARMADAASVILDYRKQKGKADAHSTEVDVKPKNPTQTQAKGTTAQEQKNQPSVSQGKGETTQDKPKSKPKRDDDGDNASSAVRKPVTPDKPVKGGAQASVPSSSAPSNVPTDAGFAAWAVDKYGNPMKFETDAEREQSRNFFEYLVKNGKVDGATGEKVKQ